MRVHHVYATPDGESHFGDIEIEWAENGPAGKLSTRYSTNGVIFRVTPGDYDYGWHHAPRRQYVVNLDAGVEITVSDGETRMIGPGEVMLLEDTFGKGHISKAVNGRTRHSVFIPLD